MPTRSKHGTDNNARPGKAEAHAINTARAPLGKTARPSLSDILPRKRLFDLLEAGRFGPAVWVSGPPGCGKTTAVASYLDHAKDSGLWYQIDAGDADVATFFYYLGLAAADLDDGGHEKLPLLTPEYHSGLAVFTRRYFQQLFSYLKPPFALVFDGYHEVPAFSQLHDVMREALAQVPPGGFVVLISRGDPPPELARFRANRALAAIGWSELRLTQEETTSIIRQRRPDLPNGTEEEIYAKTQGWAAGLVLMLEQAKILGSIISAPDLATGQLVFDYLAGEIFQKSNSRTQDFLLRTACLPQMTVRNAESLTGDAEAKTILYELHRNNYFLSQRAARPEPVFQYHPMFREFLLERAQTAVPKEERKRQQYAAAQLMESEGSVEDAIALYRESHSWADMARVIEQHAATLLRQGRSETLASWIDELPPEVQQEHPWTFYWAAASQVQIAPRRGRTLFEKAFELFRGQESPNKQGMILAASGVMDAILYELDDFSLFDRWIAELDEATKSGAKLSSPDLEARVACSMFTALTAHQPQRPDIGEWVQRAIAASNASADPNLRMSTYLFAAVTMMWTGMYTRAHGLIDQMQGLAGAPGVSPFSLLTLHNVEAMYGMLTADWESCRKAVREGQKIVQTTGVRTWGFQLLVYGYGGALGSQDMKAASDFAKQLETHVGGRFNQCLVHHFRAWDAMLRNDPIRALREERDALRMAIEVACPYLEALCRLALAEILAEYEDERKCISHLQQLRPIVEGINNRHLEFTCLFGFGRLAVEHGRQRSGLNALRRAFALGREYGYTHFLWWRPNAIAAGCVHALEAGIETDYVKNLIRLRKLVPERAPLEVEGWPWAFRLSTLGNFRLQRNDEPLGGTGKAQLRPLELLKVVVAYGGEGVSEDKVISAMWPRIDGDSAHRSFTSTLHRLRKLLGEERAIVLHEGKLTLDERWFWVDARAFDALVIEIEDVFKNGRPAVEAARAEQLARRLLAIYRGPFMASEADESWYVPRRERMRSQFFRAMSALGHYWEDCGKSQLALDCYERCLEADSVAEGFYRHLMLCYQNLDRRAEAIDTFNRCRRALASAGSEPAAETRAIYERAIAHQ